MSLIAVLAGGDSPEREVSLRSGAAVARALEAAGHSVRMFDPAHEKLETLTGCDVVFPVLHGAGGEDGSIQNELEALNLAYVGSGVAASELCFDKDLYRQKVIAGGFSMPHGAVIRYQDYLQSPLSKVKHVLKPVTGGSSIDTIIVRDMSSTPQDSIKEVFERYPTMLVEELIEGIEMTVGVLGDTVLPIIEIIPPADGEFDYENKYNGATREVVPPENITPAIQEAAKDMALQVHKLTGCRDFSRTDIMCDKNGNLFLLETNTIPGMTDQSLFPKMAAAAGISMSELCDRLVQMALNR
jgi:D-alanine-D-alanine ligase